MSTLSLVHRLALVLCLCVVGLSCRSLLVETKANDFFATEPERREAFRVFIARDFYRVKQVQYPQRVQRIADENGDQEEQESFTKEHDKIRFSSFLLEGTLEVRLDPESGQPINIRYPKARMPQTWQASKYFIRDLSRFRFTFPEENNKLLHFYVRYSWMIAADESLSIKERRRRAMEYWRRQNKDSLCHFR